jgi:3-oxoacyl-[acyl-carrier-protein] synthase-3
VAAGDVHSSGLDFTAAAADVTPLFGDGAAAAVVDAAGEGLLGSVLRTDGSALESFWCEYPASRRFPLRFVPADLEARNHFPRIDHERVARDGLEKIVEGVEEVLSQAGVSKQNVNRYVLHHVFPRIAERAARKLGIAERTSYGGRDEGHVASASLPIALCRAREQGLASTGDLVCLATAGAGVNWAASLVRL